MGAENLGLEGYYWVRVARGEDGEGGDVGCRPTTADTTVGHCRRWPARGGRGFEFASRDLFELPTRPGPGVARQLNSEFASRIRNFVHAVLGTGEPRHPRNEPSTIPRCCKARSISAAALGRRLDLPGRVWSYVPAPLR